MATTATTATFTQQATAAITQEITKAPSKKEETRRKLVAQLTDYNVVVGNPTTAKIGDLRAMLKEAKKKARMIQRRAKKNSQTTNNEPENKMHDIDKPITLEDLTNPDKN